MTLPSWALMASSWRQYVQNQTTLPSPRQLSLYRITIHFCRLFSIRAFVNFRVTHRLFPNLELQHQTNTSKSCQYNAASSQWTTCSLKTPTVQRRCGIYGQILELFKDAVWWMLFPLPFPGSWIAVGLLCASDCLIHTAGVALVDTDLKKTSWA